MQDESYTLMNVFLGIVILDSYQCGQNDSSQEIRDNTCFGRLLSA